MSTPTIAIEGTWERKEAIGWADPRSPWVKAALAAGVNLIDLADPFEWSTELDGIDGDNGVWESAGKALLWYCHLKAPNQPVNLIAHSHGGQVAAYALQAGLKVKALTTVAAPVREDMRAVWAAGAGNLEVWRHIYTNEPFWKGWQTFGEFLDGRWGIYRKMPKPAENRKIPGEDHSSLMDPELWRVKGLFGVG